MAGKPTYINLRAVWAQDGRHLIIGISNVDEEMRREHEHARRLQLAHEKALRDELCGIRNKNGYAELEEEYDARIEMGIQDPFAVTVFDVNGLKQVNDSQGHEAGDRYILSACELICKTYAHSPVFRIGGDEFVAVLRGSDYKERDELLAAFRARVLDNQEHGEVIVATGMSSYRPGRDAAISDVFRRADELMYANKKTLKGARE